MDILNQLLVGFSHALTLNNLMYCLLGVTVGTFVVALPGIGSMVGIAVLLPFTYYLPADSALIMLAGIYYGGEYGGAISSILLNIPGTASSAVTSIDGHQLTKQGRPGVALLMAASASFLGGSIGILVLAFFAPLLGKFATNLSSADYFSIMVLGLAASTVVATGSMLKGLMSVVLGILLGVVGTDINTGVYRYTFGVTGLFDGWSLLALALGLFGFTEVVVAIGESKPLGRGVGVRIRDMVPKRQEVGNSIMPIVRGGSIGSILGALPATGPTISAFLAYSTEKSLSKNKARFGQGAVEGVAAPEAANNAAAQTAFIPTLTLGIPGSATMALILGALLIQGIVPGPQLMREQSTTFWTLVASFWIGNLLLIILNIPLIGIWVRLLRTPYRYLFPTIIVLICAGTYAVNLSAFEVAQVLIIGLIGYFLRLARFEAAPLLMGFILGPLMEQYLRRALVLSGGDLSVFVTDRISAFVLAVTLVLLATPLIKKLMRKRQ